MVSSKQLDSCEISLEGDRLPFGANGYKFRGFIDDLSFDEQLFVSTKKDEILDHLLSEIKDVDVEPLIKCNKIRIVHHERFYEVLLFIYHDYGPCFDFATPGRQANGYIARFRVSDKRELRLMIDAHLADYRAED